MDEPLSIVIIGLSITSSWGNGHAVTYRGLVREMTAKGHDVLFLERDVPWYRENRDLPDPPYGRTRLYQTVEELFDTYADEVANADLVMVGSYVPDGVAIGRWVTETAQNVTAFYDIDTPVTLAKLERGDFEYIAPHLIARYQLYLSFTGGPILKRIETNYGSPRARALYCAVDPADYYPEREKPRWDLGYLGTYAPDRQPIIEELLFKTARRWSYGRFTVAGALYPEGIAWPSNVSRTDHIVPSDHRRFYCRQRFTLNATRADMVKVGYSPSVRLFEAAACGVPVISDYWNGLERFFEVGREILVARTSDEVLGFLRDTPEHQRLGIARRARTRVLAEHTAAHRVAQLERYLAEVRPRSSAPRARVTRSSAGSANRYLD